MKKITLFITLIAFTFGFSQEILKTDYPLFDGTFGDIGAATLTYNAQSFIFPTGAETWGGFANNNTDAYPFQFDNGGQIVFTATTATDTQVRILFEANPYPGNTPSFDVSVNLLATNPAMTEYSVDIPAYTTSGQTFNSVIFYVAERDVEVSVGQFKIKTYAPPSGTDASLSSIQIDGSALSGFSSATTTYDYNSAYGTTTVPTISGATTTDAAASFVITQATSIPGSGTILVTAADGTTTSTYTVNFAATLPPSNAPTPIHNSADVVSVYSDTYTGVNITNLNPNWGQSGTVNELDLVSDGNMTLEYKDYNYQGTEISSFDASATNFLHIDLWTLADPSSSRIKVTPVTTGTGESLVNIDYTSGQWNSINIPVGDFTGLDLSQIYQFKFASNGPYTDGVAGDSQVPIDIYLDNIYFYSEATQGLNDNVFNTVKMFPNPAKDTVQFSVKSNENLDIEIFDMLGKSVLRVNDVQNEVNISDLNSGLYFVQMTLGTQQATKKLIVN